MSDSYYCTTTATTTRAGVKQMITREPTTTDNKTNLQANSSDTHTSGSWLNADCTFLIIASKVCKQSRLIVLSLLSAVIPPIRIPQIEFVSTISPVQLGYPNSRLLLTTSCPISLKLPTLTTWTPVSACSLCQLVIHIGMPSLVLHPKTETHLCPIGWASLLFVLARD